MWGTQKSPASRNQSPFPALKIRTAGASPRPPAKNSATVQAPVPAGAFHIVIADGNAARTLKGRSTYG
jgi:hypothetical protein